MRAGHFALPQRHFRGQMQQGDPRVLQMFGTCVILLLRVDVLLLADRLSKTTGSQQGLAGNKQTSGRGRGYDKSGEGSLKTPVPLRPVEFGHDVARGFHLRSLAEHK